MFSCSTPNGLAKQPLWLVQTVIVSEQLGKKERWLCPVKKAFKKKSTTTPQWLHSRGLRNVHIFTHKASSYQPHSAPPGPSPRKKFLPFQHPAMAKCLHHKVLVIGHIIRYLDLGSKLCPAARWITLKDVLLACIHQAGFSIHCPTKMLGSRFMRRFPANVFTYQNQPRGKEFGESR